MWEVILKSPYCFAPIHFCVHLSPLRSALEKLVTKRLKYRHTLADEADVEFYMVGENATIVENKLDQVCWNDMFFLSVFVTPHMLS
jgi:hypothetical protein